MTVAELIWQLQNLPRDLEVFVQDPHSRVADECSGVNQETYFVDDWEGGNICLDAKNGEEVAIICQG